MRYLKPRHTRRPTARPATPTEDERLREAESLLAERRLDRHRTRAAHHTGWMS